MHTHYTCTHIHTYTHTHTHTHTLHKVLVPIYNSGEVTSLTAELTKKAM